MKRLAPFRDFRIEPLVGALDTRSQAGAVAYGDFRLVLNMEMKEQKKRRRMGGWQRLLGTSTIPFANQDLHDQLLDCQSYYESFNYDYSLYGPSGYWGYPGYFDYNAEYCGTNPFYPENQCNEAINGLFEAVSTGGRRTLIASTRSRIYSMSASNGNWRIIGDRLGGRYESGKFCGACSGGRWKFAQLGNFVVMTNNIDPVLVWRIGDDPDGCDIWSVQYMTELMDLDLLRAGCVESWVGFIFIGNVTTMGEYQPNRIYWSDFNSPTQWTPGGESAAGYVEFGAGERVLAMAKLGGQLRVYTSTGTQKAIYDVALVGGTEVFNFREIYRGPDGLEYENSLVNTGKSHYYIGQNGFQYLGEYDRVPQRLEWIHKSSGVFYSGIDAKWVAGITHLLPAYAAVNESECQNVIGGYNALTKDVWFSWPTGRAECPDLSLKLNIDYLDATIVDYGWNAFSNFRPDYSPTVRDFFLTYSGCDLGLVAKQGLPAASPPAPPSPLYLYNATEDVSLPPDDDSLYAVLCLVSEEDICGPCSGSGLFVLASASDFTLKQWTPDQYLREEFTGIVGVQPACPDYSTGVYRSDGYTSLMQSDPFDYIATIEKLVQSCRVEFDEEDQTIPNDLYFQLMYGSQPAHMVLDAVQTQPLAELSGVTEVGHALNNTRPRPPSSFPLYRRSVYLAWRFWVTGLGGGVAFNSVTLSVRPKSDRA